MVTLRIGGGGFLGVVAAALVDWDAVADGDVVWSDEDVFDDQSQHALTLFGEPPRVPWRLQLLAPAAWRGRG
jgi:hypothetical protein